MMTATTRLDDFRQAIEQAGLTAPETIIADGKIHRFASNGDPKDDAGWYVFHNDGIPAGSFGNWRSDLKRNWCAKSDTTMSALERAAYRHRLDAIQRQRDADEQRRHVEAAERARAMWEGATPAPETHPYLIRKGICSHGLRIDEENRLIVPVMIGGRIASLQTIDSNGEKQFLPGGKVKGGTFHMGEWSDPDTLLLCEGFATGASVHEASGYPVAITFSAGNLLSVAQALRAQHPNANMMVCGDHDASGVGQAKAREAATAVNSSLAIPAGEGMDWNDVFTKDGVDAIRDAIDIARKEHRMKTLIPAAGPNGSDLSFLAPRPGGLPETIFHAISAPDLLAEVTEPTEWILDDYLPAGALALIAGKPKEGKTTLVYQFAVQVAQGGMFLGRPTKRGGVLILAVEEHRRDVKARLQGLGADILDNLFLRIDSLSPSPTFFAGLSAFIADHDITLVIIDTLAAFWSIENENDASEMTRAVKPLLALARGSGACVLLIHHARKSEGSHGDEIRGSGALFGLVDIAIVMKRHSVDTQRLLQAQSRYPETPSELVIELREAGYVSLGDPAAVGKVEKLKRLREALTETPEETATLAKKAGLSRRDTARLLDLLIQEETAIREGMGKRNDPHRFRRFVSGNPPILRDARKQETLNSFLAPPNGSAPPARNETRDDEVIDEA
jgi:phage/plasmid primase-like uncharacterized protein